LGQVYGEIEYDKGILMSFVTIIFLIIILFMKDLFKTAIDFHRLEKVEIGGVKGKALSLKVFKIFEEFKEEFDVIN
jgi:hypothetical protein